MKTVEFIVNTKESIYTHLKNFSKHHKTLGRLGAIPVAILDGALDVVKHPLYAIEHIVLAALNLVGAIFRADGYTIKEAIKRWQWSCRSLLSLPLEIAFFPLKVFYQLIVTAWDPTAAVPFDTKC